MGLVKMTKKRITKKPSFLKSFILRVYRKKVYLKNLEQDFARQSLQIDSLKEQLKLAQV